MALNIQMLNWIKQELAVRSLPPMPPSQAQAMLKVQIMVEEAINEEIAAQSEPAATLGDDGGGPGESSEADK